MRRKMTPTGNLTREEWLQLRRNGIGGSDASVIMGKNPGVVKKIVPVNLPFPRDRTDSAFLEIRGEIMKEFLDT